MNKVISLDALQRLIIEPLRRLIYTRTEEASDEDIINMLLEVDAIPVVMDENGAILTDESENIVLI